MTKEITYISIILWLLGLGACSDKASSFGDIDIDPSREIALGVEMVYSDSAKIKFKLLASRQDVYMENDKLVEEYPQGINIKFFDADERLTSSMRSKYAKRVSEDGVMTLKDSVVLVNHLGDQLTTTGITWDELNHRLRTQKYVQMVKASSKDTFFGFGFEAIDDFSRFSITQFTGKRKYKPLTKELGLE